MSKERRTMAEHPTPWELQIVGRSAYVIDAERDTVSVFHPSDVEFWERVVKAMNNYEALAEAAGGLVEEIATRGTHERWKRLANVIAESNARVGTPSQPEKLMLTDMISGKLYPAPDKFGGKVEEP
jgi:hypothetical protein